MNYDRETTEAAKRAYQTIVSTASKLGITTEQWLECLHTWTDDNTIHMQVSKLGGNMDALEEYYKS
jgi:hypothetical protein